MEDIFQGILSQRDKHYHCEILYLKQNIKYCWYIVKYYAELLCLMIQLQRGPKRQSQPSLDMNITDRGTPFVAATYRGEKQG